MALKILGHKLSPCTQRVLIVLAEKSVKFELSTANFVEGENKISEKREQTWLDVRWPLKSSIETPLH